MNYFILPNEKDAKIIFWGEPDDEDHYEVVEELGWKDDGKYSYKDVIFRVKDIPGSCFRLTIHRSGSYFTDYHYEFELECPQVYQTSEIVIVWKNKE